MRSMTFEVDRDEYAIGFFRDPKQITVKKRGSKNQVRYPATTARLLVRDHSAVHEKPRWTELYTATVHHFHKDLFTLENGRVKALEKLTPLVPKELRQAMWKAYLERPRPKSEPKPKPEEPPTPVIMEGSSPAPESL